MKTICLRSTLLLLFIPLFFSCDKNESTDSNEQTTPENTLTLKDISGVWTLSENDIYFLALYPSGRYTFCLSDYLIGSGSYYLNGNTLTLNDGYTFRANNLTIKLENDILNIRGDLHGIPNPIPGIKEYIKTVSLYLQKENNEDFSKSVAGFSECRDAGGLNAYYSNITNELNFISDYVFKYKSTGKSKQSGKWKTLKDETYYYTYREPYVYCYNVDNNPTEIEIYDFCFLYEQCYFLGFSMDMFRVN